MTPLRIRWNVEGRWWDIIDTRDRVVAARESLYAAECYVIEQAEHAEKAG